MIHRNKRQFSEVLERTSGRTGFPLRLLEKDYYLTILLGGMNEKLDENLIFKGGTCLNKIYFEYFRLSEDLDFTLVLPEQKSTKGKRSAAMKKIKNSIKEYTENLGLRLDESGPAGRNESRQYVYYMEYDSVITGAVDHVKFEVGLRANPCLPAHLKEVKHVFKNPFTEEDLFKAGNVKCMQLPEIAAEKLRAAVTRKTIAPRDFFDLHYLIMNKFDFKSLEFKELAAKKFEEDGFTRELKMYYNNLRPPEEIESMVLRFEDELYPVLTQEAKERFDLKRVIKYFKD
ncbi:MAG: nucleotidyl transferase AbiEii/AbiGii toxin family protein [Candidatus Goldbacteria bacterium]|nr:nucleotidyl transferase AbiEii/AbiGii toxin family protein [Candidatus Goldiibacteriota bacterium]